MITPKVLSSKGGSFNCDFYTITAIARKSDQETPNKDNNEKDGHCINFGHWSFSGQQLPDWA